MLGPTLFKMECLVIMKYVSKFLKVGQKSGIMSRWFLTLFQVMNGSVLMTQKA